MTIWNMLIVVKHRDSVDVETNWWWWLLKTFDLLPYAIIIKSINQIMAWLYASVGSRLLKVVTIYDDLRLQITCGERDIGVKLHSIVTQLSQSSTTMAWVDWCENWETAFRLNHLILWEKCLFGAARFASTHKKFDIDTST